MDRRQFNSASISALAALLMAPLSPAHALSLEDLSETEAAQGLKAALEKGAPAAVSLLGQADGFLGNPKVRISLPGFLEDASKILHTMGQGRRVDELVTAMNPARGLLPCGR